MSVISGSIATTEDGNNVGLNAVNCKMGQTLTQEEVTPEDKEHVLAALRRAATSSLEALKTYSLPTKAITQISKQLFGSSSTPSISTLIFPRHMLLSEQATTTCATQNSRRKT